MRHWKLQQLAQPHVLCECDSAMLFFTSKIKFYLSIPFKRDLTSEHHRWTTHDFALSDVKMIIIKIKVTPIHITASKQATTQRNNLIYIRFSILYRVFSKPAIFVVWRICFYFVKSKLNYPSLFCVQWKRIETTVKDECYGCYSNFSTHVHEVQAFLHQYYLVE